MRAGKVRYVGLSNVTGWQVRKTVDTAVASGLTRPVTLQPQYSLLSREIEWEIVPACESTGGLSRQRRSGPGAKRPFVSW